MGDIYDPYYADDEIGYFSSVTDYIRIPVYRPKKIKTGVRILNHKKSKGLRKYYNYSYNNPLRFK